MKKPAKFNTYLNAMNKEARRMSFCDVMEEWSINEQELDECEEFENFIRRLDEIPEQKTCYFIEEKIKSQYGSYSKYVCSKCNKGVVFNVWNYCPYCGAKVIKDEQTSEV